MIWIDRARVSDRQCQDVRAAILVADRDRERDGGPVLAAFDLTGLELTMPEIGIAEDCAGWSAALVSEPTPSVDAPVVTFAHTPAVAKSPLAIAPS